MQSMMFAQRHVIYIQQYERAPRIPSQNDEYIVGNQLFFHGPGSAQHMVHARRTGLPAPQGPSLTSKPLKKEIDGPPASFSRLVALVQNDPANPLPFSKKKKKKQTPSHSPPGLRSLPPRSAAAAATMRRRVIEINWKEVLGSVSPSPTSPTAGRSVAAAGTGKVDIDWLKILGNSSSSSSAYHDVCVVSPPSTPRAASEGPGSPPAKRIRSGDPARAPSGDSDGGRRPQLRPKARSGGLDRRVGGDRLGRDLRQLLPLLRVPRRARRVSPFGAARWAGVTAAGEAGPVRGPREGALGRFGRRSPPEARSAARRARPARR